MGLSLRYNLYHNVSADAVFGCYKPIFANGNTTVTSCGAQHLPRIDIHASEAGWVVVNLDAGWEWCDRRVFQLYVSSQLDCPGFLIFVYDGDFWGYEFFGHGQALDWFLQDPDEVDIWFPHRPC